MEKRWTSLDGFTGPPASGELGILATPFLKRVVDG